MLIQRHNITLYFCLSEILLDPSHSSKYIPQSCGAGSGTGTRDSVSQNQVPPPPHTHTRLESRVWLFLIMDIHKSVHPIYSVVLVLSTSSAIVYAHCNNYCVLLGSSWGVGRPRKSRAQEHVVGLFLDPGFEASTSLCAIKVQESKEVS